MSQWSHDESRAHGLKNAADVTCPTLVISNTADHHDIDRPELLPQAVAAVTGWLDARGF